MKAFFKKSIILISTMLLLIGNPIFYGYAFFDDTLKNNMVLMQTGVWAYPNNLQTYFTGFETITNYYTGFITMNVDGENLLLCNAVTTTYYKDKKIDSKSLRIKNIGFISTESYFIGLKELSFYVGLSKYGNDNGPKKYEVSLSQDNINWTTILSDKASINEFEYVVIDINSLLKNGLWLNGGMLATINTPLQIKISFNGVSPIGTNRIFNLDNFTFTYVSKL